jgi:hypothetical protein
MRTWESKETVFSASPKRVGIALDDAGLIEVNRIMRQSDPGLIPDLPPPPCPFAKK